MAALLSTGFKYWNSNTDQNSIYKEGYEKGFRDYISIDTSIKTISCGTANCTSGKVISLEDALKLIEKILNPEPIFCYVGIVYPDKVVIGAHTLTFENILELAEAVKKMQGE
jgi:hypothetical protein